jgi:Tol biopolymer transport system component
MLEMQVHDPDGTNPTRLKSYSTIYRNLTRCGVGGVAYWASDDTHGSHIARTDILTGSTTRLTDGPSDGNPTCTADGSTLVFQHCTDKDTRCAVTRKSLDSGQSASLYEHGSDGDAGNPILSPDGNKVLLTNFGAKYPYEWLAWVPLTGGSPQMLKMPVAAAEVTEIKWAPDGKSILYSRAENGVGNIWSAPLDGKAPRKLTAFDSDAIFAFDVSPDNRLALSRGSFVRDVVLIKNAK